jgi:tetratricopeptide (TPR) repeat protein
VSAGFKTFSNPHMRRNVTYILIVFFFAAGIGVITVSYKMKVAKADNLYYALQPRKGALSTLPEWTAARSQANTLSKALKEDPTDKKSALALAALFVQEARVTGSYAYYDLAAMKQVDHVLKQEPDNFQALLFKALIQLSQHHFPDGLAMATRAQQINPYNAFVHGILVDANVELGQYKEAVSQAEKMMAIRPDLTSYSRVSYLREIHGDLPGAIEAMKMAVDAGAPGADGTEWARVQLGHLYESMGDLKSASLHYQTSLDERPGYAPALAGLGHIAMVQKEYATAIHYYQQADTLVTDFAVKEELVDVYRLCGETAKADALAHAIVTTMRDAALAAQKDPAAGHYTDKELAYAYLKIGDTERALEHALAEYNRRPENIDVNETVAWVYYKQGKFAHALPYMQHALRTNCKNPTLLCHAGLVYAKGNQNEKAKALLTEALKNNPSIAVALKAEAAQVLQTL